MNIARGKPTKQSTGGENSRLAVDGNRNPLYSGGSCTHTSSESGAWWRVDLLQKYAVTTIRLTNRADCCWERLKDFDIRVGNTDDNPGSNEL